jgi:TIR domain
LPRIFISYRRDDSQAQVGRLYGELRDHFGKHAIYRDIDSMKPGEQFADRIERELRSAAAVVAVIGDTWLDVTDAEGNRRLEMPNDYVRQEIATALREGKPLIPLLVNGAQMPRPERLPEELAPLVTRNALELVDRWWKWGMRDLFEALEAIVGAPASDIEAGDHEREESKAEDLEAERQRFRRAGAVREFLASHSVAHEEKHIKRLLELRRDEPLLAALTAEKPDIHWRVSGPLVATPTRLIYLVEVPPLLRIKTFEYEYRRLARVTLKRGKKREDSNLLVRVDVLTFDIELYSGESTQFRMYPGWEEDAVVIANVIHTRTEDGVVTIELTSRRG